MTKKIFLTLLSLALIGCSDIEKMNEQPINLGTTPTRTKILDIVSSDPSKVFIMYSVTTGSKYSVEIFKSPYGETPLKNIGFTADEEIETVIYNFSDLENGLYDLTLTDISGNVFKKPLIIKR